MLIVKNMSKFLGGRQILHNINFCLKKGEIIALLGPNGSGKTTLMRTIIGFYEPEKGEILFNNEKLIDNRQKILENVSYVPETGGLYPEMTVFEYLMFMAKVKRVKKDAYIDNFVWLSKALDLESVMHQKCDTLSKGYRRRVAIAGAMLSRPKLLILDEPTEGLDPQQKLHLRDFLKNYGKDTIILISTHIMEEVDAVADRILMIKDGKMVCDTTPDELKNLTPKNSIENSFCTIIGN